MPSCELHESRPSKWDPDAAQPNSTESCRSSSSAYRTPRQGDCWTCTSCGGSSSVEAEGSSSFRCRTRSRSSDDDHVLSMRSTNGTLTGAEHSHDRRARSPRYVNMSLVPRLSSSAAPSSGSPGFSARNSFEFRIHSPRSRSSSDSQNLASCEVQYRNMAAFGERATSLDIHAAGANRARRVIQRLVEGNAA